MNLTITQVSNDAELEGILALQQQNLRKNITAETLATQGFVTVEHTFEILKGMHNLAPSVIAKDGDKVVGYAIVMLPDSRYEVPALEGLFAAIETIDYKGKKLSNYPYSVVGQLCVGEGYRGMGLVDKMYNHFRECLEKDYEMVITDISSKNPRSMKAHQRVGYQSVSRFFDELTGEDWDIVVWDWRL